MQKPSFDEVAKYATPLVHKFINDFAPDSPHEHKDEMVQSAMLRLWKAYATLNADDGWKSFVWNHSKGAVLDYLKFGKGFKESSWTLHGDTKEGKAPKLTKRVQGSSTDVDEEFDLERTLGNAGILHLTDPDAVRIKWELLAKMCSQDENLHAFAKYLRGLSIEEMAPVFGLCRTRVSQMIQTFVDRFDNPEDAESPWFMQICFALDICKHLGMADQDQSEVMGFSVGWNLNPVDLDSVKPHHYLLELDAQMDMFDGEEKEG